MENIILKSEAFTRETRLNYWLSLPEGYEGGGLPLILFLHGSGERGNDPAKMRVHGIPKLLDRGVEIPAITLCPQCPADRIWDTQVYDLKALVDKTAAEYKADMSRLSVTGLSMGGFGTWMMAATFPGFFARVAPVCGGGMTWLAPVIKGCEIRAFHGSADTVVSAERSREMVEAVKRAGGSASLTVYEGVGHDSWVNAYERSDLADWLAFKA